MGKFSICSQVAANTGLIDCDTPRGVPQSLIVGSKSFSPSDYATTASFKAAFIAAIKQSNTASSKLFPLPIIQGTTDKTDAAKEGTLGYGLKIQLLRSKPGYEFDVLVGSSLEKKLMKFNNKTIPVFVFDDSDNIWGVTDSAGNFSGANYLVTVEPRGYGDAQNPKTTKISISIIDAKDFVENSQFASTDFATTDLVGLLDGNLSVISSAANVWHFAIKIKTDEIKSALNVHDTYATGLASASMWRAFTGANFSTALTITSVTDDTANGGWIVTFDSTAFTALASTTQIKVNLADVPTLDAAGITGIEGNYTIIVKP